MNHVQIFSRRNTEHKTDFRPDDPKGDSPYAQLRRLSAYMESNNAPPTDITDCNKALSYLRELCYRKIFTGTSHADFVELDNTDPEAIDWLIAVHSVDASNHQNKRNPR